jgi:hypothetical protein
METVLGSQLDVTAIVEDVHAGGLELLNQPAQRQTHF